MLINGINSAYSNPLYKNNFHKTNKMTGVNTQSQRVSFGLGTDDLISDALELLTSVTDNLCTIRDVVVHDNREKNFETYIDFFSMRRVREKAANFRKLNIEDFNNILLRNMNVDIGFFNGLLKEAGINTVMQMEHFARTYTRHADSRKIFKRQEIEAVKIYGILKSKDEIAKYPELLLYLYNKEEGKENPDYNSLNEYTAFLKQVGLEDFKDFDSKFAHLKPDFNDFATIADKADAIDYLRETYNDKIAYLNEIIAANPELKSFDAQKVYAKINDVVDTLYKYNSDNTAKTAAVISYAMSSDKIKPIALKNASSEFNNFETVEDKILLYELLSECGISPNDFNSIASRKIVSDISVLSCIINKQELSQYIADYNKKPLSDGEMFYKKNADIVNAVYDEASGNVEGVNSLLDLAERFSITGSDSFLNFYNRTSGTKNKNLTSDEIKDFVELFKYSDSQDLFKQAKERNVSVVDILIEEKNKFELVKDKIEQFMLTDDTAYFAGKTPLDVYKNYGSLFSEPDSDIADILHNISTFNIENSLQYEQKSSEINKFAKFFTDRESLIMFISDSGMKFDESEEDEKYRNNCLDIFESLYDESDISASRQRIDYMVSSGFLSKSKIKLTEFLSYMPDETVKKAVLTMIADKKVPSLNALEKFFRTYNQEGDSDKALLSYLQKLPDNIDFKTNGQILSQLQGKINQLNIPIQINSGNIGSVNIESIDAKEQISNEDVLSIVSDILEVPQGSNFISALPFASDSKKHRYDSFRIAQDIVAKKDMTDESYSNIVRILGLDKADLGLASDCSDYTYIKAIEKVLPKEFIKFVNSNDWLDYKEDGKTIPNLILHARLRAIDRFALNNAESIDNLYTDETKDMLKSLFKSVYESKPLKVKGTDASKRIIINSGYNSNVIEAVFSNKGEMITIVPARKQRA